MSESVMQKTQQYHYEVPPTQPPAFLLEPKQAMVKPYFVLSHSAREAIKARRFYLSLGIYLILINICLGMLLKPTAITSGLTMQWVTESPNCIATYQP